ncbi:nuclear transport factor 2 family protein [Amycolatopsis sp. NPDC088138]|uniref:nuclear transport factor 2 family protein n=1 Tax=Amycolatopsis sp. NPDC088138 TaxID=3363938 RepID=UPI003814AE35
MSETVENLVQRYLDAWNEPEEGPRRTTVEAIFTENGGYVDPNAEVTGRNAFAEYLGTEREKFGGLVFTLGRFVDEHHGTALFTWRLGNQDGTGAVATGYDAMVFENGRIRQVYGFFD